MKTIVINTSKEAKRTKLDVLFNAPFGKDELLWYESDLSAIGEVAGRIKDDLIREVDIVDKDYRLAVLVDVYMFPNGNEIHAARLYKALMARYIGMMLVRKLDTAYSLCPLSTSVYFADSARFARDVDLSSMAENAIEQENARNRAMDALHKSVGTSDDDGNLVENEVAAPTKKRKERSFNERMIMELFGWNEEQGKDDFPFLLKVGDETLDFSESFAGASESIRHSHKTAKVLDLALTEVKEIADCKDTAWDAVRTIEIKAMRNGTICCLTHNFSRDNEQVWLEGFFNIFANIFSCVGSKAQAQTFTQYDREHIEGMLTDALHKYIHFSDEKHISATFEPVESVWQRRTDITTEYIANARRDAKIPSEDAQMKAEQILADTVAKARRYAPSRRMRGLDGAFYSLVDDVFANYDPDIIREQNAMIVKECLSALWKWRDQDGADHLERTVRAVVKPTADSVEPDPEKERETLMHIQGEYEQEHATMIRTITEVEHRLQGNKNILLETKDMIICYTDLMRKGKKRLIAFVGAIIALVITIAPFVCLQLFPADEKIIPTVVGLGLAAGFSALYAVASGVYLAQIVRQKHELIRELEAIKKKSEADRLHSIRSLYTYYTDTVLQAESLRMLWSTVLDNNQKNAVECIKRNNHIRRLTRLTKLVKDFCTMLKLKVDEESDDVEERDERHRADKGRLAELCLIASESFYSPSNQKIYSVLPAEEEQTDIQDGEGETTA